MKRTLILILVIMCSVGGAWAEAETGTGIVPPPALNIPYGGKVVTDLNLSDGDVLGMVKQALPVIGEVASMGFTQELSSAAGMPIPAQSIDFTGMSEAIAGVTNVRVLIAKYPAGTKATSVLEQVNLGVAKIGRFRKVASDTGFTPGATAVYVQENNGGYIGYMYNASDRTLYAGRIVGFLDMPKLTQWAMNIVKTAAAVKSQTPDSDQSDAAPESVPDPVPAAM